MRRIRTCSVALLAAAAAAGSEDPAPPDRLDPALLSLCKSIDVVARRYCLDTIAARGDPDGKAREIVADMAANDQLLKDVAATLYRRLYSAPPPAAPAPGPVKPEAGRPPPAAQPPAAGDPMRVVYAPTAFTRPEGTASFNAFELGTFAIDKGMSPNLALGLQTALPVGAFVFGPTLRIGFPFSGGAVGFHLVAVVFIPLVGNSSSVFVAGGGPMLTLGDFDRYFNAGVLAFYASSSNTAVFAPHAGFSVRISPGARLGAEAYLIGWSGDRSSGFGKFGLVLWGLRIFGESLWGDIALAEPICDSCGGIYRVLPIGIPFLNFGLSW